MLIKKTDASVLVTTTVSNTKIKEVENKTPSASGLVKNTDDIGGKYFTTADYNKFTSDILDAKIK